MARKRKIPVRKHHGIRDPLKQQEQREKKLSKVTNNPPERKDEQQVSFKFRQFKQLADATKTGKKVKLGAIGKEDKPKPLQTGSKKSSSAVATKETRNIKQFANETDEDYLRRVNRITNASVREAQYEAKYGVNVLRDPKTGEITIQKRPKNEIDELLKQKQKERRAGKGGRKGKQVPKATMDAKTSRELIKRAYKEAKEEVDSEDEQNAPPTEYKRDTFAFGEIVHAPPSLKTLPRKAPQNETVPRPGRKSNLLLKSLLDTAKTPDSNDTDAEGSKRSGFPGKAKTTPFKTPTKAQMKGKRKDLPAATRSMLETERNKMVLLYRQLKNQTAADP
ncbi:hypothetical protein KR026_006155 [Drosophila bipectinata]|nr:hypothetical protein KR026_006155 [Drosophila bipectinata]